MAVNQAALRRILAQQRPARFAARAVTEEDIEQRAEKEGPGLLLRLAETLAVPGQVARGGIRSLITGEPFERTTARELLASLGIEPEAEFTLTQPTAAGTAAGAGVLATDILTDPLTLLAGIGQLGKGARALRGAQQAVRRGVQVRRAGREAVEDIFQIPPELQSAARQLGAQARLTPEEIAALRAGRTVAQGPVDVRGQLLGAGRRAQREEFARARELFAEAERLGTRRAPGRLGLISERAAPVTSLADLPRGARLRELTAREGFRVPREAPGARELLTLGIPFTEARARVPIPRAVERLLGGGVATAVSPLGVGLQRIFGRGGLVSPELRQAEALVARQADSVQGIQQAKIQAREEELVMRRADKAGATTEEAIDEIRNQFRSDIRGAREGSVAVIDDVEQEFADSLSAMVDARTFAQYRRGARDDTLLEEYAERLLTRSAREALRQRDLMDPFKEFISGQFSRHNIVQEGSQLRRRDYLPELTNDANQWFRDQGILGAKEDFFNLDVAETVSQTIQQRSMSTLQANLVDSFVRDLENITGRAGDVPIGRFLQGIGMKRFRGAEWKRGANLKKINQRLAEAGVDVTTTIPREAVREFRSVFGTSMNKISTPALDKFLRNTYDPLNSIFRVLVTAPFPAFHARNFMSNVILNFLGGVLDIRHYARAIRTFATVHEPSAKLFGVAFNRQLRNELTEKGVLQGGQLQRIIDEAAERGGQMPEGVMQTALNFSRQNPLSKFGFNAGQWVEDVSRLAHFFGKKAKGATDLEAVSSVNKFLFDYSNRSLNGLERGFLNRITYFYRWNRFALPLVLRTLFEHPNRAAVALKATVQPEVERPAGLPEFIRESAAIPAGVDPVTGETTFAARLGSPFEVLELLDPTAPKRPGILGQVTELGREAAQQMVPPLKAVFQIMAGENFFLGRDIQDLDRVPAIQALFGEALGLPQLGEAVPTRPGAPTQFRFRGSPELGFALSQLSPLSRLQQTGGRFADLLTRAGQAAGVVPGEAGIPGLGQALGLFPEGVPTAQKTTPQELLRTLLGVQLADVDVAEEARRRARRVVSRELQARQLRGEAIRLPIFAATEKGKQEPGVEALLKELRGLAPPRRSTRRIFGRSRQVGQLPLGR